MSTEEDAIEAQRDELRSWLASGVDIDVYEPTPDAPSYRAVIAEFGLTGEGETYQEAFAAVIEHFATFLADLIDRDLPLPDRSVWFTNHPRPTAGGHD